MCNVVFVVSLIGYKRKITIYKSISLYKTTCSIESVSEKYST